MKHYFIIVNNNNDKIVKRLIVNYEIEDWQKQIILNDFCEINEFNIFNYSIFEIK